MDIKTKDVMKQSFNVTGTSGTFEVSGTVTLNKECQVTQIEGGSIKDGEDYLANFSMYGTNLNVNYTSDLTLSNQQKVLSLINDFKKLNL